MRASYPGRMVMLWKSRLIVGVQTIREVPLRPKQGRLGMCKVLSLEKHTTAGLQEKCSTGIPCGQNRGDSSGGPVPLVLSVLAAELVALN